VRHLTSGVRQQELEWRRSQVLQYSSQGYSIREVAQKLQINKSTVSRDLQFLKQQAKDNLQHHIHETIPLEYHKAMDTLNQVLKMCWSIVSKTIDEKTRLQALALINDVNKYRTELVTNGVIVHDSLQIIQSKMEHLNGNGKDKGKRLLEEIEDNEQQNKYSTEQEEQLPTTNGVF
jgi:IS30 family transposase